MTVTAADLARMRQALAVSRRCPPAAGAYNVGAVIVDATDRELAFGFSRETDAQVHAEESAIAKLPGVDLRTATIYTTLEPCSRRASRPLTCTQLILRAGIRRAFFALYEPPVLAECEGVELLTAAGVTVIEIPLFAADVAAANAHLLRR